MSKNEDASFCFLRSPFFIHQSLFLRLLIPVIGLALGLGPSLLFAQQRTLPRQAESAKALQLRQQWFYQQRAYPNKHIPPGARLKAYQQMLKMRAAQRSLLKQQTATSTTPSTSSTTFATTLSTTQWTLIGPQPTSTSFEFNPVSGRVTALAVDPTNSNVIYLGGAEGGVWKSTDGGTTWTPLTDNQPSLAVGSIAIDPQNPQTIYVGTGEQDYALYNYAGAGILKSTDGGASWTQLPGPFVGPFDSQSPYCGGAYIGSLAVQPGNSQVLLAGVDFDCSYGSGMYRSSNGGSTWTEVLGTQQAPDLITSLVFDPVNGNNAYAAVGASSSTSNDGIWKSTNAGLSWTLSNGSGTTAFPGSSAARISLAIAASSPTTLYAGVASSASGGTSLLGVYKTTNGGGTWTQLTTAPPYCSPDPATAQCYFDNVVAVAPNNPNIVLLGGSESATTAYAGTLYLSVDGGSTWQDITADSSGNAIHPDMHAIAFSKDGSKMFAGNDGGLWSTPLSSTGVGTWTNLNQTLALTQFYPGMSIDPTNSNNAFAGTQDNGVQEYSGSPNWNYIGCGDGGQTAFNYSDLNTLYLTCQYTSPNTGDFLFKLTANPPTAVAADNGIDGTDNGAFIPPLTMDPSQPDTLYFGTYRLYQTTDAAADWKPISGDLTFSNNGVLSTISAITVAPSDSHTVYVGTGDGRLWMTTNVGSVYCCSYIAYGTPNRSVTAIAVNPTNAQTAYASFSGYSGFGDTLGHVFETTNGGTSWTDISGNLPNIPVNDIVVDPDMPNTLYIGTDVGVFTTTNGGTSWSPLGTGLPAVAVMSLKLQHATRILRAASYGRSAWDIQLPAPIGPTAVLSAPTLDFAPQQAGTTSSAQTVTLTNNSSTALSISSIAASSNFAETNTCGTSLAAGANCTISVTFSPATFGALTGSVTITDNAAAGSPQSINLNGKGFSGTVSLSPTTLTFGNQLVGTTSTAQTVTLTNNSSEPLAITGFTPPTDFTVTSDCPLSTAGALAAGASCHINISFAPTAMGDLVEQVSLSDSAADSPQTIPVTGTGIAPVISLSLQSLTFTNQEIGTTSPPQTITLTNTGTADLTISSITINDYQTPSGFPETDNCPRSPSTIAPQGTCTINVTFSPYQWYQNGNYGTDGGTGTIISNAFTGSGYFSVYGTDYSGAATVSPTSLNFGHVPMGQTSPPQTVTVTNSGSLALYFTSILTPLDVTESDNCPRLSTAPQGLAPGSTCTIQVTYAPSSVGSINGRLIVSNSAIDRDQVVTLSGDSLSPDFALGVASGTSASGTVTAGGSASYSETVTPQGGFNQAVALACSGAPAKAACTVSPASVTLDGTNSQSVKVTVTTTAPSLAPPGPRGGPPPAGTFPMHEWWMALLWLLMMGTLGVAYRQRRRSVPLLAGGVLLAALAMSCGGGGGSTGGGSSSTPTPGTPAGTYTLTVTGTSGSLSHQSTVTLTVQ